VAPPALLDAAHRAKYVTDWHTPVPMQAALAAFIEEGLFARHLRRMSSVYRARHAALTSALERDFAEYLDVIPSAAGLHVAAMARSSSVQRFDAMLAAAGRAGIALRPLSTFTHDQPPRLGLVLGYGAITVEGIEAGLRRLRDCFTAALAP
jgi:GntR family transcriptional regulator/MocR family aminotransferase